MRPTLPELFATGRDCRLADRVPWPDVPVEDVVRAARSEKAELVGVSYWLTPETGERLLAEFAEAADDLQTDGIRRTNPFGHGQIVTRIDRQGACLAVDPTTGQELTEQERITLLGSENR